MIGPAAAPRPAPVARLRLRRVQLRHPAGAPVFHVFQELFERAVEHRPEPTRPTSAARS